MKINFLAFLVCYLISGSSFGQANEFWFAFKVTEVEKRGKDQFRVVIDHGSDVGLTAKQSGQLWTTVNSNRDGYSRFVANVVIQEVTSDKAIAMLESNEPVYVGDVVFAQVLVKQQSQSIYFFLMEYGIELTDEAGKPYYTVAEILTSDGSRLS